VQHSAEALHRRLIEISTVYNSANPNVRSVFARGPHFGAHLWLDESLQSTSSSLNIGTMIAALSAMAQVGTSRYEGSRKGFLGRPSGVSQYPAVGPDLSFAPEASQSLGYVNTQSHIRAISFNPAIIATAIAKENPSSSMTLMARGKGRSPGLLRAGAAV